VLHFPPLAGCLTHNGRLYLLQMWTLAGDVATEGLKNAASAGASHGYAKFITSGLGSSVKVINDALMPLIGKKFITIAAQKPATQGLVRAVVLPLLCCTQLTPPHPFSHVLLAAQLGLIRSFCWPGDFVRCGWGDVQVDGIETRLSSL
jgi:hypothetical protein